MRHSLPVSVFHLHQMMDAFQQPQVNSPKLSLFETDDGTVARLEIPGFSKEDLEITVHKNKVTIAAIDKQTSSEIKPRWARDPFLHSFSRAFSLHYDIDAQKSAARVENGILTLQLPRAINTPEQKVLIE